VIPLNTGKSLIPLSIGDPTVFGNLQPPPTALAELTRLLFEGKSNGYAPSTGTVAARTAIATRYSPAGCQPLTPGDVMICSGASGALHILLDAMLQPGDNLLCPKPGFSLYATIAGYLGAEVRYYNLLPDSNWECDMDQMATLVDSRTRGLLINNPSNPNGSNFSVKHLHAILQFAQQAKLPIVADEIYADMVFSGAFDEHRLSCARWVPLAPD
jgi:tyrosine aminotransferase